MDRLPCASRTSFRDAVLKYERCVKAAGATACEEAAFELKLRAAEADAARGWSRALSFDVLKSSGKG